MALLHSGKDGINLYKVSETENPSKLNNISDKYINKDYLLTQGNLINYKQLKRDDKPEKGSSLLEALLLILSRVFSCKPVDCIDFFVEDSEMLRKLCIKGENLYNYTRLVNFFNELIKDKESVFNALFTDNTQSNINMLMNLSRFTFQSKSFDLLTKGLEFKLELISYLKKKEKLYLAQLYLESQSMYIRELMLITRKSPEYVNTVFELMGMICNKLYPYHKFFELIKNSCNKSEELEFRYKFLMYLISKCKKDQSIKIKTE